MLRASKPVLSFLRCLFYKRLSRECRLFVSDNGSRWVRVGALWGDGSRSAFEARLSVCTMCSWADTGQEGIGERGGEGGGVSEGVF